MYDVDRCDIDVARVDGVDCVCVVATCAIDDNVVDVVVITYIDNIAAVVTFVVYDMGAVE